MKLAGAELGNYVKKLFIFPWIVHNEMIIRNEIILTDCNVGQTTISVYPSYKGSKTEVVGFADILIT